jgi:chemotaxis protein MotB
MAKPAQPIIIKKVKKGGHAHHGGAWKIAYADFVTAMMAFFLLMWLINMTTVEQKKGLAEYFSPSAPGIGTSGAGPGAGPGQGARSEQDRRVPPARRDATTGQDASARQAAAERAANRPNAGAQENHSAMASIRQALQNMPEITEISRNIVLDVTRDGLNVSLVDQEGRSMFPDGSVYPYERTRRVLEALAPTIRRLPHRLSVTGHTATARPGSPRALDSWSLTVGRALAVREILVGAGLPDDRFASVVGRADTEPLFPENPYVSQNRRIAITLLSEAPPAPPGSFR